MDKIVIQHLNESFSYFETSDLNLKKKVAELLSPYADNYQFSPTYRAGVWNGRIPFYKIQENKILIPKGIIFYLEKLFKNLNIDYSIEKTIYEDLTLQDVKDFIKSLNIPFEPYNYQTQCVFDSLTQGRLTNISATGSGKSLMIYMLARYFQLSNRSIMIIVPNIMLVNQIYEDFKSYGFEDIEKYTQQIGGEHKEKELKKPIIITTWQSQYRERNDFYDVDCVIVDECQGVKGTENQLKDVILPKAIHAKYRFGFTGTLPKKDIEKMSIYSVLGKPNRVINARGLIDGGLATPVSIKVVYFDYPEDDVKLLHSKKDFRFEEKFITEHTKRNNVLASLINKVSKKGNTLALYAKLSHGDLLLNNLIRKRYTFTDITEFEVLTEIKAKDVNNLSNEKLYFTKTKVSNKIQALLEKTSFNLSNIIHLDEIQIFCVSGEIKDTERERIRQILETHNNAIILGTLKTMSTGINIKKLHSLIFCSSSKSEITLGQSIGRIMRLHDSKAHVKVYDIVDNLTTKRGKKNYFMKHFDERLVEYIEGQYPMDEIILQL